MDYSELSRLAQNPPAVRALAGSLLGRLKRDVDFDADAEAFLVKVSDYTGERVLTTRQREFLHALRERATRTSVERGWKAADLLNQIYVERHGLDCIENQDVVEELHASGPHHSLTRGQWRFLFALYRELNPDVVLE